MAARLFAEETSGQSFEVSTMPTTTTGVMRMTIRTPRGDALLATTIETQALQQIRWTGQNLQLSEELQVQYTMLGSDSNTRMGYLFEFNEGSDTRSLMVPAKDMAWLLLDPDVQEALLRR